MMYTKLWNRKEFVTTNAVFLMRWLKYRILLQKNLVAFGIVPANFCQDKHDEIVKYTSVISQWLSLARFKNSANSQIRNQCRAWNSHQVYQHVVHDMKSEIGCAVPCKTIFGPLFPNKFANNDRFEKLIFVHSSNNQILKLHILLIRTWQSPASKTHGSLLPLEKVLDKHLID